MRDADILDDRDIQMLCQRMQGRPDKETARMFNVSRQLLQRRLKRIPAVVQEALGKLVRRQLQEQGAVLLTEDQMDAIRSLLRKARRVTPKPLA